MTIKTFTELSSLATFEERYRYLRLRGLVGETTFGFDRYINQKFYRSAEWKAIRDHVIVRDNGCDLGVIGRDIREKIIIHHMNPISIEDVTDGNAAMFDPEFLICTTHSTHNAIHYSDEGMLVKPPVERSRNDTCPWRRN